MYIREIEDAIIKGQIAQQIADVVDRWVEDGGDTGRAVMAEFRVVDEGADRYMVGIADANGQIIALYAMNSTDYSRVPERYMAGAMTAYLLGSKLGE